jgi:ribosomal protein S18 acetylase RimI-like enzyme
MPDDYSTLITAEEDEAVRQALIAPLRAHNESQAGPSGYRPLVVQLRDAAGQVVGGAWGYTAYGWMFIQLLVVPEAARGRGLGERVMREAEAEALARGCHGAWVDTHSFQAPGFYARLGYETFGELPDYPPPFKRHFFRKRLVAPAT